MKKEEATTLLPTDSKIESKKDEKKKDEVPKIGYSQLFRFATPYDKFLISLGLLGSIANGIALPLMVSYYVIRISIDSLDDHLWCVDHPLTFLN